MNSITSAHYTFSGHAPLANLSINAEPSLDELGDAAKHLASSGTSGASSWLSRLRKDRASAAKEILLLSAPRHGTRAALLLCVRCQSPDDKEAWVSTLRGLVVKLGSVTDFADMVSVTALDDASSSLAGSGSLAGAGAGAGAGGSGGGGGGSGTSGGSSGGSGGFGGSSSGPSVVTDLNRHRAANISLSGTVQRAPRKQGGSFIAAAPRGHSGSSPSEVDVHARASALTRSKLQTLLGTDVSVRLHDAAVYDDDDFDDEHAASAAPAAAVPAQASASSRSAISSDGQRVHELIAAGDVKGLKRELKSAVHVGFAGTLNADGLTPLAAAVRHKNPQVLVVLLANGNFTGAELNLRDEQGYTALHWAARNATDGALSQLLARPEVLAHARNLDGNTALHYFVERCSSASFLSAGQRLIDRGAHVNATNNNGETALHKAMFNNTSDELRQKLVRWLLANHADPNIRSVKADSPLHYAVYMGHPQLVLPLLQGGADLDALAADGSTALEIARREQKPAIVSVLQEYRSKFSAGLIRLKQGLNEHGLQHVLHDADLNRQLFAFQESRLCGECVVFWNNVEQYRTAQLSDAARKAEAARIVKLHFQPSTDGEVNLSSAVKRDVMARFADAPLDLFDAGQEEMLELMLINLRTDGLDVARVRSPGRVAAAAVAASTLPVPEVRSRANSLTSDAPVTPRKANSALQTLSGGARQMLSARFDDDSSGSSSAAPRRRSNSFKIDAPRQPLSPPPTVVAATTKAPATLRSPPPASTRVAASARYTTAVPSPAHPPLPTSQSARFEKKAAAAVAPAAKTLHAAVLADDAGAARELLTSSGSGARLDERDADGMTPLSAALKLNAADVLEVMLAPKMLRKKVLSMRDELGYQPLHWAARSLPSSGRGDRALVNLISLPGVDINARNDDGNTPLHYFAERCASPTVEQLLALLVQRGADIHARNKLSETPLHKAVLNRTCGFPLVQGLLRAGADVNAATQQLETPLHYAIHVSQPTLFAPLLQAGADPNRRTSAAHTAFDLAQAQPELEALLRVAVQANVAPSSPKKRTALKTPSPPTSGRSESTRSTESGRTTESARTESGRSDSPDDHAQASSPPPPVPHFPDAVTSAADAPPPPALVSGKSIRSTTDEAQEKQVLAALADEDRSRLLLEHMARNRSPALVLFLQAVLLYTRIANAAARVADAQEIYEQHLAAGAPHFVALDSKLVQAVYQDAENGDNDLFDACFRSALQMLAEQLTLDCFEFDR
jgi:ankyrin repeat protein